ncbi:TPA: hypothetical protein N0F65_002108 [Lagenidium giganteum]|uniref:Uncharacterized protein n=1 Tax=Lagenidium giganteum TaxID=4803 RepID=A0AAV2ZA90_9STRA|nr:TPA: hypothetical protein N0F65_002108 [Lagenidium giganteum]
MPPKEITVTRRAKSVVVPKREASNDCPTKDGASGDADNRRRASSGAEVTESEKSTSRFSPVNAPRRRHSSPEAAKQAKEAEDSYRGPPLHQAVRRGDVATVARILRAHPKLARSSDKSGNHPLHYAVDANTPNNEKMVCLLLTAGALTNEVNLLGQTPLYCHVLSMDDDNNRITRLLLHFKASPKTPVDNHPTVAHYAAARGLFRIAAAMSEHM